MNLDKNKKSLLFLITYTILLFFFLLHIGEILLFGSKILQIFFPFLLGAIIAFVFNVFLNVIEKKWLVPFFKRRFKKLEKYKRGISLFLAILLILFFLGFLLFLVVPELKNSITIFIQNMPAYTEKVENSLAHFGVSSAIVEDILNFLNDAKEVDLGFIKKNQKEFLGITLNMATNLLTYVTNIVLGIVFAIYILAQKEHLKQQFDKILKAYIKEETRNKMYSIFSLSHKICSNFISGQCLEAFIIGGLCFVGMLLLRLPYATTISVLIGFTALIPVFGAFIGTIVGAFLIFMVQPIKAVLFVLFILVLQQVEGNIIYPKVVGKSVGLPGIWVMLAVTVGASFAGIAGMLLSVPLCSILYSIFTTNVKMRLEKQKDSEIKIEGKI